MILPKELEDELLQRAREIRGYNEAQRDEALEYYLKHKPDDDLKNRVIWEQEQTN